MLRPSAANRNGREQAGLNHHAPRVTDRERESCLAGTQLSRARSPLMTGNDPTPATEPKKLSTTQARQGITPGIVRYVLMISITLAIIAMVLAYAFA
jgi:hypothetical protein